MRFVSICIRIQAPLVSALVATFTPVCFGQASQNPVSSQNATITYGQSFTPSYMGGSGTGSWQFCVSGQTNFNPGPGEPSGTQLENGSWATAWTPPAATTTQPYQFYIAHSGDGTYATAMAGWYSLTVNKANQPSVSSQNTSSSYSGGAYSAFVPPYFGGAGTGGWQFCIDDYTNWSPGPGQPTGTELPNGQWVSSWTPAVAGTYLFYIANNGDSNYNISNFAGWYNLTVYGPVDGITWNGEGLPSSGSAGQTVTCYATVTNSGTSTWTSNYYLQITDSAGNQIALPSVGGAAPGQQITVQYSITLPSPSSTTGYTYYYRAENASAQYFGNQASASVTVYPSLPSITSLATASGTVGLPLTYQITATNGPTSYNATGLPPGLSVNTGTGLISGTPTIAATTDVTVTATNAAGTSPGLGVSFHIGQGTQPAVFVSPTSATVSTGQQVTLTASGGAGTGAYTWGGGASGTGTSNSVSFSTPNTYYVTVYRAGDSNYQASSPPAQATITVNGTLLPQTVVLSPSGTGNSITVAAGTTVMFSVSGGQGQGTYVWSGNASGSNAMEAATFSTVGSAFVSVYHSGDSTYQKSNTATVNVTVVAATNDSSSQDTQLKYLVPVP